MNALVSVRNLTKIHAEGKPTEVRALDDVSFEVPRGAFYAIVGESGSGKTTLMHVLGGLDRATSGNVIVDDVDLAGSRGALALLRARKIGFIFQGFNLIPSLNALENVMLAAQYARVAPTTARNRARELLSEVGLGERLQHLPAQLSGGQQQRVAIARALINEPALILADEPTGELDTKTADAVLALLEKLNRERGQTIVVVTHSSSVWRRAQRVIRLADGRIESIRDASVA